jgi:integrase
MPRKLIKEYGSHGRSVRVFVETFKDPSRQALVRVFWREAGKRCMESLPNSRDNQTRAKLFAEGVAERLTLHGRATAERLTMLELGERYLAAHPTPETWRPKTRATFIARWKVWLAFATPARQIDTVTHETLDALRGALRTQDYAINQVANTVQMVKAVYRFARTRRYLVENPIADYTMRLARGERRLKVPEWTADECARILAELSPKSPNHWRAYVGVVLSAVLGGRANAMLSLEWRDVDLNARTIRWRPELDKLAKDRVQPLPRDAVRALRIALVWRDNIGYTGAYVVPGDARRRKRSTGDTHYTYQALNQSLRAAADRAGVTWVDYRALHGFRRMVLNNALAISGNLTRAGQFIGDTDMRTLTQSYVRDRPEELRDVARSMHLPGERPPNLRQKKQRSGNTDTKTAPRGRREKS